MEPVPSGDIAVGEFDLDKVRALPVFDPADYLQTAEAIAAFINDFLHEGDPAMITAALGIAARAKGMAKLAEESGIAHEDLCDALRKESVPSFDTILRVMNALGLRLVVEPMQETASPTAG